MNDDELWQAFENCRLTSTTFGHREHLRIAYLTLRRHPFDAAHRRLKRGLRRLLRQLGAPPSVYHETLTRAWLMAVAHFMHRTGHLDNSQEFLSACQCLLDKKIMYTHYRREVLGSDAARRRFVEPDLRPIPRHESLRTDDGR